jgi:CHAT domain-containing protein
MNSKHFEQARLVVLSACQTAITDFNTLPDEAIGLPAGFFQAGVPGVVGSLWPVNDVSTALLMEKFYELHLQGDKRTEEGPLVPARALCRAQLWLRDVTAATLAARFGAERRRPASERHLPYEQISAMWRRFASMMPEARPFAHPYYWAAFTFSGV